MYCGLLVGNSIVNIGTSSPSPGARLKGGHSHPSELQSLSRHAEMDALRYFRNHSHVRKAKLVIVRPIADGKYGNSRPCMHCIQRILRYHANVCRVVYFEDGSWYTERPEVCAVSSRLTLGEMMKLTASGLKTWELKYWRCRINYGSLLKPYNGHCEELLLKLQISITITFYWGDDFQNQKQLLSTNTFLGDDMKK